MGRSQVETSLTMGKHSKGKKFLKMHCTGHSLTRDQAIKAQCYDCMGGYVDGFYDCNNPPCPLYPFSMYHGKHELLRDWKGRIIQEGIDGKLVDYTKTEKGYK